MQLSSDFLRLPSKAVARTLLVLLSCAILSINLAGCSSKKTKDSEATEELSKAEKRARRIQEDIKETEKELYESAQRAQRSGQWNSAIQVLQSLEENFPFGAYAQQSQLELIYVYYQANEYASAIAAADRFIRLHPTHRSIDYAYYMRGVASFYQNSALDYFLVLDASKKDLGSASESMEYFTKLIHQFPGSAYTQDAQKRMIFLRNLLARHEIHVANYYFRRGAHVAAANRGKFVVENYQGSPAIPDALAVMAHAYHLLEYDDLANNAITTLQANFPSYPALEDDGEFDFTYAEQGRRSVLSILTLGLLKRKDNIAYDTREAYTPAQMLADKAGDLDGVPMPDADPSLVTPPA